MRIKGKEEGRVRGRGRDRGRVRERRCSHIQTPTCNILSYNCTYMYMHVYYTCHECTQSRQQYLRLSVRTCTCRTLVL